MCDNRTTWSRHIGSVIRDSNVVPYRTLHWTDLSSTQLDHIWRAITPFEDNVTAIRANPPRRSHLSDWHYLLERRFFTPEFKKTSISNTSNRANVVYKNHAGCISFSQVERRGLLDNRLILLTYFSTHIKKPILQDPNSEVPAIIIEKVSALHTTIEEDPSRNELQLTEYAFGSQGHGRVVDMEGIVSVFESRQLQIQTTRSWDYMGLSLEIPRNPTVESNIIIGHFDTGVVPDIESFSDHNLGDVPKKWKGVCDGGKNFTCNKKLIGARYYGGDTAIDTKGHGTHTASTAVGRVLKNANFFGIANGTARGGVPLARIATYKVCTPLCDDSYILAAFDDAIADGVDIITVSLGLSSPMNISEDAIAIGSFHAMKKGILTVQGAGNSGVTMLKTVVSNAPWIFTVAASNTNKKIINKLVLGNGHTIIGHAVNPFDTGIHNQRLVYGRQITRHCNESRAMKCNDGCIDPDLVDGKIIVCNAGDSDSIAWLVAMNANASGVILRKSKMNEDDPLVVPFPIAPLNDPDFYYIESYLKSNKNPSGRILKSKTIHSYAPIVASFSKRGPNTIFPEILKPDVTAPGINILAQSPEEDFGKLVPKLYSIQSGTSMACPHVSGATAYVKSKHPDWSPSAIKSSLMTTAWTMNIKYNVDAELGYGAGHIDPVKAVYPGLYYIDFGNRYIIRSKNDELRFLGSRDIRKYSIKPNKRDELEWLKGEIVPTHKAENQIEVLVPVHK
ncbi:subtilisin-like protease SBT4.6 [Impatiens glandulifera]|uniref:subtilisin-like protease SBT4.6 n=1 Tax=Impatiens glandulifera TaxID=253017 RepID=UPI001FB150DF|nr:subtilisin-like protease SBT4.6 [Impatiens glandulifera]